MKRRSFQTAKAETVNNSDNTPTPSLNACCFKDPLLHGNMSLTQLFSFASESGFSTVDLSANLVPGYPAVPEDEVLYEIKRLAFRSGISFSGTGVRNDFSLKNTEELSGQIDHVKQWIVAASKMGAPNISVFEGKKIQPGMTEGLTFKQIIDAFRECALFASRYGVTVAFQNNGGIIDSPGKMIETVKTVNSQWFGLMLDTSNVPGPDPYPGIASLIPYIVSWLLREEVQWAGETEAVDLKRLLEIIHQNKYLGFIPMEILGEGDPKEKVRTFLQKYQKASPI
jgi:sugar phosphate isomerase/epimerase